MWDYFAIFLYDINALEIGVTNSLFRLCLAMLLGSLVGAERRTKGQIAGVRTFTVISMGACLAMLLSVYVPQEYFGLKNGDPGRIAAQVVTGMGFIGGGAMIHLKGTVRGLTTAAGIWMTAILGMAVGMGMYVVSVVTTVLFLIVLVVLEQYEKHRRSSHFSKTISLRIDGILHDIDIYQKVFDEHEVRISIFVLNYDYEKDETQINFVVLAHGFTDFFPLMRALREIAPTKKLSLSPHFAA